MTDAREDGIGMGPGPIVHEPQPVTHEPTLRDKFAIAALPAIVLDKNECYTIESHIKKAYMYADAMIKFRSSNEGAMASRYGKKKK